MSRRSEQRRKLQAEQYDEDLRWLMSTQQGRRVVQALCDEVGIHTVSPFTGNSGTFYKIGQQDLVRGLMNQLRRVALHDVRRMEDEALAADQSAALDRNQPDDPPEA